MAFNTEYSDNWKDLGSVLVYQSPGFQFSNYVIITDFENCLIKKLSFGNLYHNITPKTISYYNENFAKEIIKQSTMYSIVIISNVFGSGKLITDMLKRKVELFAELSKMPFLALFAVKKNRLSKPHTGMWVFLNSYYKTIGGCSIYKACVVSDFGGRLAEKELKNGKCKIIPDSSDIDRAFAHNIQVPYHTVMEYLNPEAKEKFLWNSNCLSPELRLQYVDKLSKYKNPNIFSNLFNLGNYDTYMIMLYGAPRSGKTTLAKEIIHKWKKSTYGQTHNVKRLGLDNYTKRRRLTMCKKFLSDRISVIIDGDMHIEQNRAPFEQLAKESNSGVLYVEVNPSLGLAHIFNHVAVETSIDENIELYDIKDYHYYKSKVSRPKGVLLYCPEIRQTEEVMNFRYCF